MIQKTRRLTNVQRKEFKAYLKSQARFTDEDIAFFLSPSNEYTAYQDFKKHLSNRVSSSADTDEQIVIIRKRVSRGPGKKPSKKLVSIRLEPDHLERLKSLGGNKNAHIREAVRLYLEKIESETT